MRVEKLLRTIDTARPVAANNSMEFFSRGITRAKYVYSQTIPTSQVLVQDFLLVHVLNAGDYLQSHFDHLLGGQRVRDPFGTEFALLQESEISDRKYSLVSISAPDNS